jgi:UDP-N-acetylenolpyruvoylglucosamine reductase
MTKAKKICGSSYCHRIKDNLKEQKFEPKFVLGGGNNMLLTKDIDALVIHIDLKARKSLLKIKITFGSKSNGRKLANLSCGL